MLILIIVVDFLFFKSLNQSKTEFDKKISTELQQKHLELLNGIIQDCVIATSQTYVNSLKEQGKFDTKAQKKAFNMTYKAVTELLTDELKDRVKIVIKDLESYITQKKEPEVNLNNK